ncbi:MAG: IS630 family transposase [Polyangiaceae bacterium]
MAKQTIPQLSASDREELIRKGRKSGDLLTAMRFLLIARLAEGLPQAALARSLSVAPSTVSRTVSTYLRHGEDGLFDNRCENGSRKVDDAFLAELEKVLTRVPTDFGWSRPTWTRELFALELARRGYPRVSVATMGRALAKLDARLGMAKPVVSCPWKAERREERLAELRTLEASATAAEPVLFVDEVDIDLNPKIGRDWMAKGQQRWVLTPGKNEKYYVAGALDVRTGRVIAKGGPKKNVDLFVALLWCLSGAFPWAKRIHLILDNYCIHKAARTQHVLDELGGKIVLHFLAPYRPQANRIERVWLDLHTNVTRNHRCRRMTELLENAHDFIETYRWSRASKPIPTRHKLAA